MMMSLISQR